jgi:hypothetical protein
MVRVTKVSKIFQGFLRVEKGCQGPEAKESGETDPTLITDLNGVVNIRTPRHDWTCAEQIDQFLEGVKVFFLL